MNKIIILFIFALLSPILNFSLAFSLPSFYDGKPANNSYTYGRDSDIFSINITDSNLDASSVVHHIRVNEPGTNFTNTTSSCSSLGSGNWYCSNSVSGFGSLGGDGKNFLFYFDGKNTSGSSNSSENYFVTIDRSPPQISPTSFASNSYISGNFNIGFTIVDSYSGVNSNSARFFYGNTTFNSTSQSFSTTSPYTIYFDTRNFANNSTYFVYVNVSDNTGNVNTTKFTVYVDNELPTISIILPVTNSTMRGINYFQFTATDLYSGLNFNSANYTLDSILFSIPCTGSNFSATCTSGLINTSNFADGLKTINFSISDIASNQKSNSTNFYIDNNPPTISINYPASGAVVGGSVPIVATITDLSSGVSLAQFRWENSSTGNWVNLTCSGTNCTGTLDASSLIDGNYTLKVNATDNGGLYSLQTITFAVDNTRPNIVIVKPDVNQKISGNFLANITTTDNVGLPGNATYSAGNSSGSLTCVQQSNIQTFSCFGTVNSSIFADGPASLIFTTKDLAGNSFSASVNVSFDSLPPIIESLTVVPSISKTPTKVKITGVFTDLGSGVLSASGKVNLPDGKTFSIAFSHEGGSWQAEYTATDFGKYTIDVTLIDVNAHSGTYSKAASFFIGVSKCGDGICDPSENYCTCSQDCSAPVCKDYQVVNCRTGVPICGNQTGCGNGVCESGESCSSCELDCGKCSGNQTGSLSEILGNNMVIIIAVIGVGVAGLLAYMFWPKGPKPVYPGFKPKNAPESV